MDAKLVERLIHSRAALWPSPPPPLELRKAEAEGGCGVIGIASSVPIEGRHLLQSLIQMRNRGNGKGGGAALAGLDPNDFGVSAQVLRDCTLMAVAYLDLSVQAEVERLISDSFDIHHTHRLPILREIEPRPPQVETYFVTVKPNALDAFAYTSQLADLAPAALNDEFVYQFSFGLNRSYYASLGEKRAFVLSHGKDLLVVKLVGYGDDVFRVYGLDSMRSHVWIGHHRYPTKGTVWHPGGAHPFVGLNEALVHNGDFANYASVCSYLAQHNIRPQFLTDTEVSVLVFDLLHRTFGYPIEYVIEALAPTTERDFSLLPEDRRRIYRKLQAAHMHGSPDGPWFFLLAQSLQAGAGPRSARLLGITDTSMLRPQVFALQSGPEASVGFAASEKQAIDAAMLSLSQADARFATRADRIWNARGGSHTDGGAFLFTVERGEQDNARLICQDKFGRVIEVEESAPAYRGPIEIAKPAESTPVSERSRDENSVPVSSQLADHSAPQLSPDRLFGEALTRIGRWTYDDLRQYLAGVLSGPLNPAAQLDLFSKLLDRRYPTGPLRRSSVLAFVDEAIVGWTESLDRATETDFRLHRADQPLTEPNGADQALVIRAGGFGAQGPGSLALELQKAARLGYRRIVVIGASGQRFIANGLGAQTEGVRVEIFGSSGDYLASGIDGAEVVVHGNGQDQLAQIMKSGRLVVHGDVGQTFMYGAKGGEAFVLGNAAGRPLINAVGRPRVVINGTCLDYLAESFMAGDPLAGGGFVVLNGVRFGADGELADLDSPYPGGNLFSLASGGAIFVRDPDRTLGQDQLNGGKFVQFERRHWELIEPMLKENERLFGIPLDRLLQTSAGRIAPEGVYRAIMPSGHKALQPEQAWARH